MQGKDQKEMAATNISISIDESLLARCDNIAAAEHRSRSNAMQALILRGIAASNHITPTPPANDSGEEFPHLATDQEDRS